MRVIQQSNRYGNEGVDSLLKTMLLQIKDRGLSVIQPTFEVGQGFSYPILDEFDIVQQLSLLERMEGEGFFVSAELYDSVLQCPNCPSIDFSIRLTCTVCKANHMARGAVIEHLSCGNIDFDEKYLKQEGPERGADHEGGVLVCNKCGKRLKAIGVDYARPGVYYRCLSCKALLPEIEHNYTCFRCGASWKKEQLRELRLMKYVVDIEKISSYFVRNSFLPDIAEALRSNHGLIATAPGRIKGISKVEHDFDLLINDKITGEPVLVADLVVGANKINNSDSLTDNMQILAFYAKCLDTSFSSDGLIRKILVVPSGLPKNSIDLADAYRIQVIESIDSEEIVTLILDMLRDKGEQR